MGYFDVKKADYNKIIWKGIPLEDHSKKELIQIIGTLLIQNKNEEEIKHKQFETIAGLRKPNKEGWTPINIVDREAVVINGQKCILRVIK